MGTEENVSTQKEGDVAIPFLSAFQCPLHGERHVVHCKPSEYRAWREGALIQVAMPSLSPSERETLINGFCAEAWDVVCGVEDDDAEHRVGPRHP